VQRVQLEIEKADVGKHTALLGTFQDTLGTTEDLYHQTLSDLLASLKDQKLRGDPRLHNEVRALHVFEDRMFSGETQLCLEDHNLRGNSRFRSGDLKFPGDPRLDNEVRALCLEVPTQTDPIIHQIETTNLQHEVRTLLEVPRALPLRRSSWNCTHGLFV